MPLKTSLTGSYPPIHDPYSLIHLLPEQEQDQLVRESIQRAVEDQLRLGIDVLVDGQVRGDIVTLFARKMPGFDWNGPQLCVTGHIRPAADSITLADFQYARALAPGCVMKAHLTGPLSLSRGVNLHPDAPYSGNDDPALLLDLACALADEAKALVENGAEIVQIDEPVLQDGFNLGEAFKLLELIIKRANIPFPALHACGDVTLILDDILEQAPVRMVSIEGDWLNHPRLQHIQQNGLEKVGKQIGLGCINPSDDQIVRSVRLKRFMESMVQRLGEACIWAVMPNCGLRTTEYSLAYRKLAEFVEAARQAEWGRSLEVSEEI